MQPQNQCTHSLLPLAIHDTIPHASLALNPPKHTNPGREEDGRGCQTNTPLNNLEPAWEVTWEDLEDLEDLGRVMVEGRSP